MMQLLDWSDSAASGGFWAVDTIDRTVTLTRQTQVSVSNCPGDPDECWFYTGFVVDNGSFVTVGDTSPQAGEPMPEDLTGTMHGGTHFEFYASDPSPDTTLVESEFTGGDGTAGNPFATAEVPAMFFDDDGDVGAVDQVNWNWTYQSDGCGSWLNAENGNEGDITSAACPPE